jgi:hypothetical protein
LSSVTIAQGGVLPNINTLLLPKKTGAADSMPVSSVGAVKKMKKAIANATPAQ